MAITIEKISEIVVGYFSKIKGAEIQVAGRPLIDSLDFNIISVKCLSDFGFTDAGIVFMANRDRVVLTEDNQFIFYCQQKGINVQHGGFL